MTIEPSRDYALIRSIITDPAIYGRTVDDYSVPVEDFQPIQSDRVMYAIARDGEQLLGLFILVESNGIMLEIHTCLLPCAYGSKASLAALAILDWIWTHTRCQRLITNVPAHNRLAQRFALAAGMTVFGVNPLSFQYRGQLEDLIMLGLSRPQGTPCQ